MRWRREAGWVGGCGLLGAAAFSVGTIPTTLVDYFGPGTQPTELNSMMVGAVDCAGCHGYFNASAEPLRPWAASMMGQAARDPIFHAALAIAEQDAAFAGDLCLRCHAPSGWLEGRSVPTSGSALSMTDMEGVTCHTCHRMVDPIYKPGVSPVEDQKILAGMSAPPAAAPGSAHSAHFVIDPEDRRRGPFVVTAPHDWLRSPFHKDSAMCATCHDVSNPLYTRQGNEYVFNGVNTPHDTHDKYEQFPVERTYSEWLASDFAQGPINMGGLFGGNQPEVSSCQDCHMPKTTGQGCGFGPVRPDLPQHHFNGGNTWVLKAVRSLYPDAETYLSAVSVDASIARTTLMLQNASHMALATTADTLTVRVTNNSGHKLPTGYPEGRRMWVNVKFRDAAGTLIAERGAYDPQTALLVTSDTKVYEAKLGIDAAVSALSGVPAGESFHFALNNVWIKDNRIPPRGFTNNGFAAVQAAPVGYAYADGQYWDDTAYTIPAGARRADVTVYYQTISKEYIEFLRDTNTTNTAGQIAYEQWELHGKSAPVTMDAGGIDLCYADCNRDGALTVSDFGCFQTKFVTGDPYADCNADGQRTVADFGCFQTRFVVGCP